MGISRELKWRRTSGNFYMDQDFSRMDIAYYGLLLFFGLMFYLI